jgi:hypothetical protein
MLPGWHRNQTVRYALERQVQMSHIYTAQTKIVNPQMELLRQAVEIVARQHQGGEVKSVYLDYYRRTHRPSTGLALYTAQLHRGIGLTIERETGALSFIGDSWGVIQAYEQAQQEIIQTYTSLAVVQALTQMGYTPQAEEAEGQVAIRGVVYA